MNRRNHHPCSDCGRPALSRPASGKKRSRAARAGRCYYLDGHDLCHRCWEAMAAKILAQQAKPKE